MLTQQIPMRQQRNADLRGIQLPWHRLFAYRSSNESYNKPSKTKSNRKHCASEYSLSASSLVTVLCHFANIDKFVVDATEDYCRLINSHNMTHSLYNGISWICCFAVEWKCLGAVLFESSFRSQRICRLLRFSWNFIQILHRRSVLLLFNGSRAWVQRVFFVRPTENGSARCNVLITKCTSSGPINQQNPKRDWRWMGWHEQWYLGK